MTTTQEDVIKRLDDLGIKEARKHMLNGMFGHVGSPMHDIALSWLTTKEKEEADVISLRAEEREEESLSISRKALLLAKSANIIATIALIISIIIAIVMYSISAA